MKQTNKNKKGKNQCNRFDSENTFHSWFLSPALPCIHLDCLGESCQPSLVYNGTRWHIDCGVQSVNKKTKPNLYNNVSYRKLWLISMSRCMFPSAQRHGLAGKVQQKRKKNPTWNCSQAALWIMLINQVMISNQVKIRDISTACISKTLQLAPEQSVWTHSTTGKQKKKWFCSRLSLKTPDESN